VHRFAYRVPVHTSCGLIAKKPSQNWPYSGTCLPLAVRTQTRLKIQPKVIALKCVAFGLSLTELSLGSVDINHFSL
jgi:hypothetical protein